MKQVKIIQWTLYQYTNYGLKRDNLRSSRLIS